MIVPGSNLLGLAMGVIGSQVVDYYVDGTRAPDAAGRVVTTRAPAIVVRGSLQPMSANAKASLGLDMTETWAVFYAPISAIDPSRDHSGDQFDYFGRRYQVKDKTDWFAQDGWVALVCVEIGPVPA